MGARGMVQRTPDKQRGCQHVPAGLVVASDGGWMRRGSSSDLEGRDTFEEVLRRAAADARPIVLVAEAGIDAGPIARTLHALAGLHGPFVEREWATMRDAGGEILDALVEAADGTLFLHGEGLRSRLPAALCGARVQVILAMHLGAHRDLHPAFRRAAQRALVIPLPGGEAAILPAVAGLTYREFALRARRDLARAYLVELLRRHQGSVTHAALQAGMARETLHRLLKRHGLRPGDFRPGRERRDRSHHV
jgi:hypothetical protein